MQGGCDREGRVSVRRGVQLKLCCTEWGWLFFLKILTSLFTIKISLGTQISPFCVFDPAKCLPQALQFAYLILMSRSLWGRHCMAAQQVNSFASCSLLIVPSWRSPAIKQIYFSGAHPSLTRCVKGIVCSAPVIRHMVTKKEILQLEWLMWPMPCFPSGWGALGKDVYHECLASKCLDGGLLTSSLPSRGGLYQRREMVGKSVYLWYIWCFREASGLPCPRRLQPLGRRVAGDHVLCHRNSLYGLTVFCDWRPLD